jgi:hypothetical protein
MCRLLAIPLILTLFGVSSAAAQISIGVKGGVNISNVSVTESGGEPEVPFESRTGLLLGATAGVSVTPWLAVQLEGRYSQEGTQQTEDGVTATLRLSYLDFPLIAKLRIPTGESPVMPYLYAGGFLGFEVDCGVKTSGAVSLALDCDTAGVERQTNDYGAVFGAGTDVRLGPGAVTLAYSRVFLFAAGYKLIL